MRPRSLWVAGHPDGPRTAQLLVHNLVYFSRGIYLDIKLSHQTSIKFRFEPFIVSQGIGSHPLWGICLRGALARHQRAVRGSEIGDGRGIGIALAFLVGFFPELGSSRLLAKYPQMRLKRIGPATSQLCEELPLDTIVGIDAYIKFRLGKSKSKTCRTSPRSTRLNCSSKPHTICMKFSTGSPKRSCSSRSARPRP